VLEPSRRPDWYIVDEGTAAKLGSIPGPKFIPRRTAAWEIHRSHLPLLDVPEARQVLSSAPAPDWAARDLVTEDRKFKLRNVQHAAVDFITQRRGTLLGDDPRVGKTLAAIMSHDPSTGPLVVICPAMVRPVWLGWLSRVYPGEPIGVFVGREFDHKVVQHKLIVGHYDILAWWQSARPIGTLVFDEAHLLTNRASRRSKAAIFLASRAHRVICATGTPIWNLPTDLWNVLGLVAPDAFGGFHDFSQRYGAPVPSAYGTKYTGVSNEQELRARLSEVMIRRRWVDVADDLPPISRNISLVELDDAATLKLDLMAAEIAADKSRATTIGLLSRYRQKISHIKGPVAVREACAMLDRGEPVVIWTWHRELAEDIAADLGERAFLVTGDVVTSKRDEALAAWNAHPAAALVCTMAVAQVGLDFSHAHLAIFAEIDYTPAILAQAEMRTYAPTRPMNITYVVANHMIDQRIVVALTKKLDASNPLGVGAAGETIFALDVALNGPVEEPDMDRLLADILSS
jgi:SNF2 family DNA or RNA helicase